MLITRILRKSFKHGRLHIIDSKGRRHSLIGGDINKPDVTFRIHNKRTERRLFLNPQLALGEAYMEGNLTFEQGGIYDLLDLVTTNMGRLETVKLYHLYFWLRRLAKRLQQYNPLGKAQENVAHHYDLSGELYDLFLDEDRQYSCAYFQSLDESLEEAQYNKKRHLASKLQAEPHHRVLDIGCGWGGLGLYLAEQTGAHVTGITLSKEQFASANKRAKEEGLSDKAVFELQDYREREGTFDRIVSVGMFEHVGVNHYDAFFKTISDRLSEDGIALIHSIGRVTPPTATNPWTRKYIFPGGYVPALSEVLKHIENNGFWIADIEILRLHYAETLKHWRARFHANWDKVASLYDERFCRMWDYYLASSEVGFRNQDLMVFQLQLTKQADSLPLCRDYMVDWERAQPDYHALMNDRNKAISLRADNDWQKEKTASG